MLGRSACFRVKLFECLTQEKHYLQNSLLSVWKAVDEATIYVGHQILMASNASDPHFKCNQESCFMCTRMASIWRNLNETLVNCGTYNGGVVMFFTLDLILQQMINWFLSKGLNAWTDFNYVELLWPTLQRSYNSLALNSHDLRSNHHVFLNEVNYVTKAGWKKSLVFKPHSLPLALS